MLCGLDLESPRRAGLPLEEIVPLANIVSHHSSLATLIMGLQGILQKLSAEFLTALLAYWLHQQVSCSKN